MEWGKQYFLTATIRNWQNLLMDNRMKDIIINEWKHQVGKEYLEVHGFVIMPNHYHAIISFIEQEDAKLPWEVLRDIHKWVSKGIINILKTENSDLLSSFISTQMDRKYHIWQRYSLPIWLYDDQIAEQKLDYIHSNPLQKKWQLVDSPEKYYYSSAAYYLLNTSPFDFIKHYRG